MDGHAGDDESNEDLWGLESLKQEVDNGWFVPSRAEFSAYMDMICTMLKFVPSQIGLSYEYWTSSMSDGKKPYRVETFDQIVPAYKDDPYYVRLSTTF